MLQTPETGARTLRARRRAPSAGPTTATAPAPRPHPDRWVLAAVVIGSALIAGHRYADYRDIARLRWDDSCHDRHTHYLNGLHLALDVRHADVVRLFSDLDGARMWPPLHALLVAPVLLVGGLDYRLAVLPSLAGWLATAIFAFLAARRAVPRGGNCAGLTALVFVLASPAHAVFATDTMLESLGAGLSMLCLYLYLVAAQGGAPRAFRWLALALTALFLEKYNYWAIVAGGILAAELLAHRRAIAGWLRATLSARRARPWIAAQLRHPLTYAIAVPLAVAVIVDATGGAVLNLAGVRVSVTSPHNPLSIAYAVLFVRIALWCRSPSGRSSLAALDARLRQFALWHLLPVSIYLLLPKRLGYVLKCLSPANGANSDGTLAGAVQFYWSSIVEDYHLAAWAALAAVGLAAIALLRMHTLRPGARALFFVLLIAAALTVLHPNRKSRFLHTWLAVGWGIAGAGLAAAVYGTARAPRGSPRSQAPAWQRARQRANPWERARPWLATAAVGSLAVLLAPGFTAAGHSPERGHRREMWASTQDLTHWYLPRLADARRTALFATMPMKQMLEWSFLEAYPDRDRIEVFIEGFGLSGDVNERRFARWLARSDVDALVFIDVPVGSYYHFSGDPAYDQYQQYRDLLASQTVFRPEDRREFPQYGCTVTIWRRPDATPSPSDASP